MLDERLQSAEIMDDPELDPAIYESVLEDLARVNRVTLAYRPTLGFLGRVLGRVSEFSLLDVGFGHGDMLREIAHWASRTDKTAHLTGVDLDPRSIGAARGRPAPQAIRYMTGDHADLAGQGFDFVVSNLVTHHMHDDEVIAFLRFMDSEARRGWFVNDLHRHTVSYHGYPLLARMLGVHEIVRRDGQTSIARSRRRAEWNALLDAAGIEGARIERHFPFRLCIAKARG